MSKLPNVAKFMKEERMKRTRRRLKTSGEKVAIIKL